MAAFAHHLSEVFRIARTANFITSRFYNDLWNAWAEAYSTNASFYESEGFIKLSLAFETEEGGAE